MREWMPYQKAYYDATYDLTLAIIRREKGSKELARVIALHTLYISEHEKAVAGPLFASDDRRESSDEMVIRVLAAYLGGDPVQENEIVGATATSDNRPYDQDQEGGV